MYLRNSEDSMTRESTRGPQYSNEVEPRDRVHVDLHACVTVARSWRV